MEHLDRLVLQDILQEVDQEVELPLFLLLVYQTEVLVEEEKVQQEQVILRLLQVHLIQAVVVEVVEHLVVVLMEGLVAQE